MTNLTYCKGICLDHERDQLGIEYSWSSELPFPNLKSFFVFKLKEYMDFYRLVGQIKESPMIIFYYLENGTLIEG